MPAGRIASYVSSLKPAEDQRPWPRFDVDVETWSAIGEALGEGGGDLLALWSDRTHVYLALRAENTPFIVSLAVRDGGFPAIGALHAPAIRLERTIRDLYGHTPIGAPDRRPWVDHGAWGMRAPLGGAERSQRRGPGDYDFLPVRGEGLHEIPVGPVHAGIIEPGHFRFTANGETVVRLEERLGYVHKGIEGLLTDADLAHAQKIVARVSGDSTVAAGFAFARAVEAALDVEVPPRAHILRGAMAELERIANHVGDIGAICNDAALAILHSQCGILRERVLAACDAAFGHRLMMDLIVPGGMAQDITPEGLRAILAVLDDLREPFREVVRVYDDTPSIQDRTCGTGTVGAELAVRWAAGGHVGRASGRSFDARRDLAYPPYDGARFEVPVLNAGDVNARVWIRIREVETSMRLLQEWLASLPPGPTKVPVGLTAEPREGVAVVEAFRGDFFIWLRLVAGRVSRCHVRDASCFQWPLLEAAIDGNIVADFPLCNKSFNCSYAGHDV